MDKILILFLFLSLLNANGEQFVGEKLTYSAGFRIFSAGEAKLEFASDSLQGDPVYTLNVTINTNSFLDRFYRVRDRLTSWLDPNDLSLKKVVKSVREGNYKLNHNAIIQGDSIAVIGDRLKALPGKVFDPVSIIYFLRIQNLKPGNEYQLDAYDNGKIKKIIVKITGREFITVPSGKYNCLRAEPVSSTGEILLKNKGEMRVWFSDDSLKIPLKIEQKTNIGTMVMKLKEISRLNP